MFSYIFHAFFLGIFAHFKIWVYLFIYYYFKMFMGFFIKTISWIFHHASFKHDSHTLILKFLWFIIFFFLKLGFLYF